MLGHCQQLVLGAAFLQGEASVLTGARPGLPSPARGPRQDFSWVLRELLVHTLWGEQRAITSRDQRLGLGDPSSALMSPSGILYEGRAVLGTLSGLPITSVDVWTRGHCLMCT